MAEAELQESAEFASDVIKDEAGAEEKPEWIAWTAIFAMVLALFSAVGALFAGISANEALLERTEEIAENADRNRDRIRLDLVKQSQLIAELIGKESDADAQKRIDAFEVQIEALNEETNIDEKEFVAAMRTHDILAIGVTILSIAITLCGMAMVTLAKPVWHCGFVLGIAGIGFVTYGFYTLF